MVTMEGLDVGSDVTQGEASDKRASQARGSRGWEQDGRQRQELPVCRKTRSRVNHSQSMCLIVMCSCLEQKPRQKATESRKPPKAWAAAEQRLVARGFLSLRGGVLRGAAERVSGALCRESRGGREGLRLQGGGLPHPVVELEVAVHQAELELGLVDGRLRGGAWRVVGGALVRWYVVSGW